MGWFTSSTLTLTTGEVIKKADIIEITPMNGKDIYSLGIGDMDYRSYWLVLSSGDRVEVLERNHPHDQMVIDLGFS